MTADDADARLRRLGLVAGCVLGAAAYAVPLLAPGNFWLHLGDMVLINAIMALGLHIVLKTGQVSMAHAAFMAIGAYTSSRLTVGAGVPFLAAFVAAGLLSGLVALLLGRVILRLKGVYFILFSFALNEFIFLLSKDLTSITGGNTGVTGIPAPTLPWIDGPLQSKAAFYVLALSVFLILLALLAAIYRSPLGRAMDAVRDSELLAESTGYDPMRVKVIAFGIGALVAGLGGSLFAHFLRYIAPFNFTFWDSVNFLLMNIVGGTRTLAGPVIGALILTPLPEVLRDYVIWQQFLYGAILILFMRLLPDGVASVFTAPLRRLAARWSRGAAEPGPDHPSKVAAP